MTPEEFRAFEEKETMKLEEQNEAPNSTINDARVGKGEGASKREKEEQEMDLAVACAEADGQHRELMVKKAEMADEDEEHDKARRPLRASERKALGIGGTDASRIMYAVDLSEDEDEVPAEGTGAAGSADVGAGDSVPVRIDGVAAAVVAKKEEMDDSPPQRRGRKRLAVSSPLVCREGKCVTTFPPAGSRTRGNLPAPIVRPTPFSVFWSQGAASAGPGAGVESSAVGNAPKYSQDVKRQRAPEVERGPTHMRTHMSKKVRYMMGKLISMIGLTTLQEEVEMPSTQVEAAADELEASDELDKIPFDPSMYEASAEVSIEGKAWSETGLPSFAVLDVKHAITGARTTGLEDGNWELMNNEPVEIIRGRLLF